MSPFITIISVLQNFNINFLKRISQLSSLFLEVEQLFWNNCQMTLQTNMVPFRLNISRMPTNFQNATLHLIHFLELP